MMMGKLLAADFLKIRKKMIWFLIFLAPVGVVSLQAVNYGLRYDYLMQTTEADRWGGLLGGIHFLLTPALLLGIAIIASMVANIEHQMNAWKQLLALPIPRTSVYAAKFALVALLLSVSCVLLGIGTVLLGTMLDLGDKVPLAEVVKLAFYPFAASLPVLALQLWMSLTIHNQAIPLTVGIAGSIVSMFVTLPAWVVWSWPTLINEAGKPEYSVGAGLAVGIGLLLLGMIDFTRRDVN